jgi:hypothetical protein
MERCTILVVPSVAGLAAMFRLKGLPQHCPRRPGWEDLRDTRDLGTKSTLQIGQKLLDIYSLALLHIGRSSPPPTKIIPPHQRNPPSLSCTHRPILEYRSPVLYTPTNTKERPGPHHLTCTSTSLCLSQPHLSKTSCPDPKPSNDLPPRFNHRLFTTYRKPLPYISLPLSTY